MTAAYPLPAERPLNVARARAEMLTALVDELNWSGVAYCLLGGFQAYPEAEESDLDFMVRPGHVTRVVAALRRAAPRCDAWFVQAMQHETVAWYFVLAKQVGKDVAYLHPDCSTDYRRDGRLWLRAEDVLTRQRTLGPLSLASEADEFMYYLIKKVLKVEITAEQLSRLRALYVSAPAECCERARQFWPAVSVKAIVSAVLGGNTWRMRWHLPWLHSQLQGSKPLEDWGSQVAQRILESQRCWARATHPTGMSIAISGGSNRQRTEMAAGLEQSLRPAFRRTCVVDEGSGWPTVRQWTARVRSTLVIRTMASTPSKMSKRDRICFQLSETTPDVESATREALTWMAGRLERRLSHAGLA